MQEMSLYVRLYLFRYRTGYASVYVGERMQPQRKPLQVVLFALISFVTWDYKVLLTLIETCPMHSQIVLDLQSRRLTQLIMNL